MADSFIRRNSADSEKKLAAETVVLPGIGECLLLRVVVENPDDFPGGSGGGDGAINDGVSSSIKATVADLTNSNPLATMLVDANGDQITSFGGGTQYLEGDLSLFGGGGTPTGTVMFGFHTLDGVVAPTITGGVGARALSVSLGSSVLSTDDQGISVAATPADGMANHSTGAIRSFGMLWNGSTWDRMPGTSSAGVRNTPINTIPSITDNLSISAAPHSLTVNMVYDGSTWDRMRGDSTDGVLVNLGANNDVTITSGTVSISGSVAVTGTFWQATQPVSAASLPLPTGAATAAGQLPDGHNVIVDNASGASAVNIQDGGNSITVDGTFWQATQPISAAALPLPTGAATAAGQLPNSHDVTIDNASGASAVNIQDGGNSITIDAASLPLPTGAATSAGQLPNSHDVTIDNASGAAAVNIQDGGNSITVDGSVSITGTVALASALTDDGAFTPGAGLGLAIFALADESGTDSVDEGDAGILRMTKRRELLTSLDKSLPVYNYAIANQVHVAVANTVHWDMFNADAALVVRVLSIRQIPDVVTAVTGVATSWLLERTTAVGTGGSAQTAWLSDLNDTALDADITCRSKPTGGATQSTDLRTYIIHSEETTAATIELAANGGLELIPQELIRTGKGIVLRQNQGLRCVQVTSSSAGNTAWLISFSVEPA